MPDQVFVLNSAPEIPRPINSPNVEYSLEMKPTLEMQAREKACCSSSRCDSPPVPLRTNQRAIAKLRLPSLGGIGE